MRPDVYETFGPLLSRSFYDAAPVGLCVLSRDLRFLHVNDTMAQFNGKRADDHIGRHIAQIVPDLEATARQLMSRVVSTGQTVGPFEVVGETAAEPGRKKFWIEVWSPLADEGGDIVAASVAAIDITERKRLEQEKGYCQVV